MKTMLARFLLTLFRNILIIEVILLIPLALFTRWTEMYYSETVGMFSCGSGMLFLFIGLASITGGSRLQSVTGGGLFDVLQISALDNQAKEQSYRRGMFLKGGKLWPLAILLTAVINLALGAWLWEHHFPLF